MVVFTFTWHIEPFRMCPLKKGECLESPNFMAEGTKWCLFLYPRGEGDGNGRFPSAYLFRKAARHDPEAVTVGYSVSLITDFVDDSGDEVRDENGQRKRELPVQEARGNGERCVARTREHVRERVCLLGERLSGDSVLSLAFRHLERHDGIFARTSRQRDSRRLLRGGGHDFPFPQSVGGDDCTATSVPVARPGPGSSGSGGSSTGPSRTSESLEIGRTIDRPTSTSAFAEESEVNFTLRKLGVSDDNLGLTFGVQVTGDLHWRVFAKLELFVHSDGVDVFTIVEDERFYERLDEVWSLPLSLKPRSDGFAVLTRNGQLVLRFVLSISRSRTDSPQPSYATLSGDMRSLYEAGKFCDVTIRSPDRTFRVHKSVLCARSDVFCAMFENDTRERNTGEVEIVDVDPDILNMMVTYMYTDELKDMNREDALKLYSVADKYQIGSLKELSSSYLVACLSVSRVCSVLELAELHQDSDLKSSAIDFIYTNSKEVLSSESWRTFMETNCILSGEIMYHILLEKLAK